MTTTTVKRKRGQPPRVPGTRTSPVAVRLTPEEKAAVRRAAAKARLGVADWVRSRLLA